MGTKDILCLDGKHPHKYLKCSKSIHFIFRLSLNSLSTPKCLHAENLLGFIQQEATILETNWHLKNEESVPLWNQILDKKKVLGADIKVFGYSFIPDSRYGRALLRGINLCFTAGFHLQY